MADRDQDRELTHLTDEERTTLRRWMEAPEEFPPAFWAGVVEKASVDRLSIPVSQVSGVVQYRPITVRGDVTGFTETSYTDLGLDPVKVARGRYLVQWGWLYPTNNSSPDVEIWMQPRLNDESLDDADALISVRKISAGTGGGDGRARVAYKTTIRVIEVPETGGTITLQAKVEPSGGATWDIFGCWMQVTKIGAE